MQYRPFGKHGIEISLLGFGAMRLPLAGDGTDQKNVDEEEAIRMIRKAIDAGVNYVDTAYPYHGGESERIVAKALEEGYGEKVYLATKLPCWEVKETADLERLLGEQLENLQTQCIDMYLLHALGKNSWTTMKEMGALDFLTRAKAEGKIKYAGFSFHDGLDTFKDIIDSYDWDFCQIQLNFMDEEYQAGLEGLYYAADKEVPIIVMEPLRGGQLTQNVPPAVQAIWDQAPVKRSPASWALRWVSNFPEVSVILSGMSTQEQVDENISIIKDAAPNALTPQELHIINTVKTYYKEKMLVHCTGCGYCLPCPQSIPIPVLFNFYNMAGMFDSWDQAKGVYGRMLENDRATPSCVECGKCEEACPQDLSIIQHLKEMHEKLAPAAE